MLDRAIELDPNYAHAHAWKACVDRPGVAARLVRRPRRQRSSVIIGRAANRALARRQRCRRASDSCGAEAELQRARQGGLSSGTRAEPQSEQRPHRRAAGRAADLARPPDRRYRVDPPRDAAQPLSSASASGVISAGRNTPARLYADAIESFSKLTAPDHTHHAFLAASSAQLGNGTAAGAHAREVLQRQPTFTVERFLRTLHYQQPADSEHVREGLLKAGLPR